MVVKNGGINHGTKKSQSPNKGIQASWRHVIEQTILLPYSQHLTLT